MQASPADVARALLELSTSLPNGKEWLREIRDALSREVKEAEGALQVMLTTPTGNAGHLADAVQKILEQKHGRPVQITERANPSLVGGAILQYGDQQIDLSVRGSLHGLETAIRSASL